MMGHHSIYYCFLFFIASVASMTAQQDISMEEYQARRFAFRAKLPENSVAVLFNAPIRNRANDVDYPYHPDPNFHYLTGWKEPHSALVLFKDPQKDSLGSYTEMLYVREKNANEELWNGTIIGVDAASEWGIDRVKSRSEFRSYNHSFDQFETVLLFPFQNDVRDYPRDPNDLFDMQQHFKGLINYPEGLNVIKYQLYQKIREVNTDAIAALQDEIRRLSQLDTSLLEDALLEAFLEIPTTDQGEDLRMKSAYLLRDMNFDIETLEQIMAGLREEKSPAEIRLLKKAVAISVAGQMEVMKAMHPKMSEREIQGIHEFIHKKYGAAHVGYPSIVGAGANACVLHYTRSEMPKVNNQLVLMDIGAEYKGYTADITRTIPANGVYTPEQRQLYEIVFRAQERAIQSAKVGVSFRQLATVAYEEVSSGLIELGLIKDKSEMRRYLPHGVSHHIGLDVHDPGRYESLKPNMVITIEPGIYIPENSPCDSRWWNIGIRIEDDILITEEGPVNLSAAAPRKWDAIEKLMQQKSPLNEWVLPEIND